MLIHRLSRAFREAERRGDVIETEGWAVTANRLRRWTWSGDAHVRAALQRLTLELRRSRAWAVPP